MNTYRSACPPLPDGPLETVMRKMFAHSACPPTNPPHPPFLPRLQIKFYTLQTRHIHPLVNKQIYRDPVSRGHKATVSRNYMIYFHFALSNKGEHRQKKSRPHVKHGAEQETQPTSTTAYYVFARSITFHNCLRIKA